MAFRISLWPVAPIIRTRTDPLMRTLPSAALALIFLASTADAQEAAAPPPPAAPGIDSIRPQYASAGDTVTIFGRGLDAADVQAKVSVAGEDMVVTYHDANRVEFILPARGKLRCQSTPHTVLIDVVAASVDLPSETYQFRPWRPLNLAPGGVSLPGDHRGALCLGVPTHGGNARYLVVAAHVDTNEQRRQLMFSAQTIGAQFANIGESVQLEGGTLVGRPSGPGQARRRDEQPRYGDTITRAPSGRTGRHATFLESQRLAFDRAMNVDYEEDGLLGTAVLPEVGSTTSFRFSIGQCRPPQQARIDARAVYVGQHVIVFEDVRSPHHRGQLDRYMESIGREMDSVGVPLLRQYFGDPLAWNDSLDAGGRVKILFTHRVPADYLAFVNGHDFFPPSVCSASNRGEVVYARMPFENEDPLYWYRVMRATSIHEIKHVVSFAARRSQVITPLPGADTLPKIAEESWLEEGLAMMAEELYARIYSGYVPGQPGRFALMECEFSDLNPCSAERPMMYLDHFVGVFEYWTSAAPTTFTPRTGTPPWYTYGASWSFLRAVADRVPIPEEVLFKQLVQGPEFGATNIAARVNIPFRDLFIDWLIASALDDRTDVPLARPEHQFVSWDSRNVFDGVRRAYEPDAYEQEYPIVPFGLQWGKHTLPFTLQPASASFYELGGTTHAHTQVFGITRSNGGPVPDGPIEVAVVRIR